MSGHPRKSLYGNFQRLSLSRVFASNSFFVFSGNRGLHCSKVRQCEQEPKNDVVLVCKTWPCSIDKPGY